MDATKTITTFTEFRQGLGELLKLAGAPEELVFEITDLTYEGGGVVSAAWRSWEAIEDLIAEGKETGEGAPRWEELDGLVYDVVQDMVIEFNDPMNYPPGRRERHDHLALAEAVMEHL